MASSDQSPNDQRDDDIIPDRSNALEFEPVVRTRAKRRGGLVLAVLIMAGTSAGIGWYFYGDALMKGGDGEIPIIRAPEGPVKVRPDNPGGMAIPDRDKLIYERLKGSEEDLRVERLLPPPEAALAPPAPESGAVATPKTVTEFIEKQVADPIVDPASIPKMDKLAKDATPPPPVQAPTKIVKVPATSSSGPGMIYRVQLAAVRSEEIAKSEWKRLKKKYGGLLNGLTLNVVRVDLGTDKGVFYRLRAGPLADEATAKKLCEQLSGRKVGCLIVRPGG